jgi:GT2 family glycosyltransferase
MTSPLSIGIVNHQGAKYLADTLAAVAASMPADADVLLVDNASTDDGLEIARRALPSLRIIPLGENRGPAVARNKILQAALHDRILFLDNDVAPLAGCVPALAAALDAHPAALLAMPAVLFANAPDTVQYVGADAHLLGGMIPRGALLPAASLGDRVHAVNSVVSACFLLDRRRWPGGPLFDESFFIYFEDHEVGLRSRLMGLELLAVEGARCLHREGTPGISLRETGRFTPVRVRHTIRNRWLTILKLYEAGTLLRLAPALAAFELLQLAGAAKKGWLGHWLWSARWMAANLPDVLARRRAFRGLRRLRDVDVLVGGPYPFNPATASRPAERAAQRLLDGVTALSWRFFAPPR